MVAVITILFPILLGLNCLTEFLFNRMMMATDVLKKKYLVYHVVCAILRIIWIFLCTWFAVPMIIYLIGLFVLLSLNIIPYHSRALQFGNYTLIIYLIYLSFLMTLIGCAGLSGLAADYMLNNTFIRAIIINVTFIFFNLICFVLLRYHPHFIWKEGYDRSKVIIYTQFLFICIIYHLLDALLLTLFQISRIGYLLLVSGDVLILFLMYNFLKYNYVFEKSEITRIENEENEILIAQQYFEKEELKKLSELDSLTKTYNRREISSIMLESIRKGENLTCVFVDLDGLKKINDQYGHTIGDLMLKRFADACKSMLTEHDYLARIGGDEFLLVFLDQDVSFIEECMRALQFKLLEPEDEKERIHFSYGISHNETTVDNYIDLADQKMYECKNRKRCGGV